MRADLISLQALIVAAAILGVVFGRRAFFSWRQRVAARRAGGGFDRPVD